MLEIDNPAFIRLVEKGISIPRLEKRMQGVVSNIDYLDWRLEYDAHDGWREFSGVGFLGKNESLLGLIHQDWQVVERYGTTHLAIAKALERLIRVECQDPILLQFSSDSEVTNKPILHPDYEFMFFPNIPN